MAKHKKKDKKKKEIKKEKEEPKEEPEEESELEEEIEEQEIDEKRFQDFLQPLKTTPPILERIAEEPGVVTSLEQGMEFTPTGKKQEKDYNIKEITEDYKEDATKQKTQRATPDMETQFSQPSTLDMTSIGRGRERIGREFHMVQPKELGSVRKDYDTIQAKKSSEFTGEKQTFQENLEKRYETKIK